MKTITLKERLCHHVTGAIERGEAEAIAGIPATNHTPGPWRVEGGTVLIEDQARILAEDVGTDREWVCVGINDEEGFAEVLALCHPINSALIASAPDLLDALRFLLADYIAIEGDKLTGSSIPIEKAQAAIAKAEGNL